MDADPTIGLILVACGWHIVVSSLTMPDMSAWHQTCVSGIAASRLAQRPLWKPFGRHVPHDLHVHSCNNPERGPWPCIRVPAPDRDIVRLLTFRPKIQKGNREEKLETLRWRSTLP